MRKWVIDNIIERWLVGAAVLLMSLGVFTRLTEGTQRPNRDSGWHPSYQAPSGHQRPTHEMNTYREATTAAREQPIYSTIDEGS